LTLHALFRIPWQLGGHPFSLLQISASSSHVVLPSFILGGGTVGTPSTAPAAWAGYGITATANTYFWSGSAWSTATGSRPVVRLAGVANVSAYPFPTTWLDSTNALQNPIVASAPTSLPGSIVAAWLIAAPRSSGGLAGTEIASVTIAAASAAVVSDVSITLALYAPQTAASGRVTPNAAANLASHTMTGVSLSTTPAYVTIIPSGTNFVLAYATFPVRERGV
jgi:hypothetical protein